ncbi:MAG: hypothetical protein ACR2OB_12630 [Solirubrobacteraceae bacterium]
MPPTKRKRRSKHRGTAAGAIQSRGRTGRPPTAEERKKQTRMSAKEKRLNTPPTWKGAAIRAGFASLLLLAFLLITSKGTGKIVASVGFTVAMFAAYVPGGYYLERFLYRRRQSRRETIRSAKDAPRGKETPRSKDAPRSKEAPRGKKTPRTKGTPRTKDTNRDQDSARDKEPSK